jgi:2-(1,2-epoxy-1,2-dihydrophenyl)acetyl-CoA isomerase
MAFESIVYTVEDGVAVARLNVPDKLNALTDEMKAELLSIILAVRDNAAIKVLVLTGTGRAFCAGGDLNSQAKVKDIISGRNRVKKLHQWVTELVKLEKPVIAAVNGLAVGAGCNLVFACDLIYASEDAKFSEIFSKIGLIPDAGGLYFLPWAVGPIRAKDIVFSGRIVDAAEAQQIGLVLKVFPKDQLMDEVMAIARKYAKGPGVAYGIAKNLINKSSSWDLETLLAQEADAQTICMRTEDYLEGRTAFFEKRPPVFKGR